MKPFRPLEDEGPRWTDARGWMQVLYETPSLALKRSFSVQHVLRGLHRQPAPHAQHKVIRVVSGAIVDLLYDPGAERAELIAKRLTPADGWTYIDARYAHGFLALEDTLFEYLCDGGYHEDVEEAYNVAEQVAERYAVTPIQSAKDAAAPRLAATWAEEAAACA